MADSARTPCRRCGSSVRSTDTFCPSCGLDLSRVTVGHRLLRPRPGRPFSPLTDLLIALVTGGLAVATVLSKDETQFLELQVLFLILFSVLMVRLTRRRRRRRAIRRARRSQ